MGVGLHSKIARLKGVTPARTTALARLGIETLEDVLFDLPVRYDDASDFTPIAEIGTKKTRIRGRLEGLVERDSEELVRLKIAEGLLVDQSGSVKVRWMYRGLMPKDLKNGVTLTIQAKMEKEERLFVNPEYAVVSEADLQPNQGGVLPIYRLTGSVTQRLRRQLATRALASVEEVEEWVPDEIITEEALPRLQDALSTLHFPESEEDRDRARTRMVFGEFLLHQLLHGRARRALQKKVAPAIVTNWDAVKSALSKTGYTLTAAQERVLGEVFNDMERVNPMNRLLEGDVGTGKTLVAALAAVNAASRGWQVALLAPTEILCNQNGSVIQKQFGDVLRVAVFTRAVQRINGEEVTREEMVRAIAAGEVDLVVGTHVLLSKELTFKSMGLMIVDEQHRFGVKQRQALKDRHADADGIPHLLSMTATPIPRSLALVLYGDLDRSLLDEYPIDRKVIETKIATGPRVQEAYEYMTEEMDAGRQVFVVCPSIQESDALGVASVEKTFKEFSTKIFRGFTVEMLHGKMSSIEKEDVMARFMDGETDMVVSTTVLEVGVDVPNATVMYVEGAERFGLAQLHQLRGRVGRGEAPGTCFLHPTDDDGMTTLARERLEAICNHQNGFKLADIDLKLRGPGNIFGTDQSGFEQFRYGSYADQELLTRARDISKALLEKDDTLDTWPKVKTRVMSYIQEIHFE